MIKKIVQIGIYLIVFSLPLYLIRFEIGWVPFNLLEILIYLLFLFWLLTKPKLKEIFKEKEFFYPILILFIGLTISTLFSNDIFISAGIWKGWFLAPLFFFLILIDSLKEKKEIKNIILSLTFSGLIVACISLFYYLTHNLTYDGRLRGFYLSANFLAMYLSPILILSLALYSSLKKRSLRILLFITQLIIFFVIYLTYSYGALIGLLGASLILLFKRKKIFSLILLFLIISSFFFQFSSYKFQGMVNFSYPSIESRLAIWQSVWSIIKDHSLIGIGPGMFQEYYLNYQFKFEPYPEWAVPQPHNIFLAFWLQTGIIGLIGFIWLLFVFFKKNKPSFLDLILIASMVYILIHGLIDTTYWKNDLALIFWLIIALKNKEGRLSD